MKRYFIRLLIFVGLCFGLDRSLFFILEQPSKHFDWRYGKVREQQMSAEILLIGSSRGARGLNAEVIEKTTGKKTFNFCYPGSTISFHLYCLETFLKNQKQKPQLVILNLDDDFSFKENPWLCFRTDILYGHTKYDDVNELLIACGDNEWLSRYFNFLKIRSIHLQFKNQKAQETDYLSSKGSMPLFKKNELFIFNGYQLEAQPYILDNELPEKILAYRQIQKLCAQHKIKLAVCIPPHYSDLNYGFIKRVQSLTSPQFPILLPDSTQKAYLDSNYYYDASHLRANGARIYSQEVALQLKKYLSIKD